MLRLSRFIPKTLSLKLSLMVCFEIALLLSLSLAVMFYFSRKALREEAMHDAEQTLEGTAQHVDNILLGVEQSVGNFYWELLAHLDQPDRMFIYSRKIVECNPNIVGCAIAFKPNYYPDRELFMAYIHRQDNRENSGGQSELVMQETFANRPYTEQVWYTEPMRTGRTCWTDPLKNDSTEGEAISTFCLPIYDRSAKCVGVVAVDLAISQLSQIILSAKPSDNGYSVLLASNGSYIVHPDPEKLLHQTVFSQMDQGADPSVLKVGKAMVAGESGFKPFYMDDQKWYIFFKPFKCLEVPGRALENLHWSIGVVYPEEDIFGEYNRLLYYVVAIAIIGLLLFFVLCRTVLHRQLLPLNMLTRSTQRITDGNYDEVIPDTTREDEVGQLQDHFKKMQRSLVTHVSELKELSTTLRERSKVLRKAYKRAQEADRTKTTFLHYMTNQMTGPSDAIDKSVTTLCNNYHDISQEEIDHEVSNIQKQTDVIIDQLNHLLHVAGNDTEKTMGRRVKFEKKKEESHE
ncbi:methyl-accepting chemotaxis protein [Prevotella aff. ruminicola Tc2-24]|uniref:histidine kinase n=1 Tax=Prevotella aff. ruminicola Tc2-24 TaxID=81582 RepID=A0A1I0NG61_9BACT|nr:cache domain-containing protein [Prevotella aff. ruminicola Tc2-24]SEW00193.1 methyl-accepting chemotaxis protein [Prevotella aff. ruminicola Tc2-24]